MQTASIQILIETFRRALCVLIPLADELKIPWREPDNYHDWDTIAISIFDGFVLAPIKESIDLYDVMPFIQYDKRVNDYRGYSYIAANIDGGICPFVCLETSQEPFDTCLLAQLDSEFQLLRYIRVSLSECNCFVVAKGISGAAMSGVVSL
jgi:hypothetical protein